MFLAEALIKEVSIRKDSGVVKSLMMLWTMVFMEWLQNTVDFNWPANPYEDFKYMPWSEVVEPDSFPSNAAP